MKNLVIVFGCTIATLQVVTGCYLSLENSTGWVFPILTGLLTLVPIAAYAHE